MTKVDFGDEGYYDMYEVGFVLDNIYDYGKLAQGGPVELVEFDTETNEAKILKSFLFIDEAKTNQKFGKRNIKTVKKVCGYNYSILTDFKVSENDICIDYDTYNANYNDNHAKRMIEEPRVAQNAENFSSCDSSYGMVYALGCYMFINSKAQESVLAISQSQSAPAKEITQPQPGNESN